MVLAAGVSARMGKPKLLLPLGDRTILEHSVAAVLGAGIEGAVVVLGDNAGAARDVIAAAFPARGDLHIIYNPDYMTGQASSLRCGLAFCMKNVEAVLFCLGDQPWLSSGAIATLLQAYASASPRPLVAAPVHAGRRGNPVLFRAPLFAELMLLKGDAGARGLIERYAEDVLFVESGPEILLDVDTPEDYLKLLSGAQRQ